MPPSLLEAGNHEKMQVATAGAQKNTSGIGATDRERVRNDAQFVIADKKSIHHCASAGLSGGKEKRTVAERVILLLFISLDRLIYQQNNHES